MAERLAAAQAMMDSGRARRAEPLYRLVLRADPDNLDGWRGLGHASVRLRRGRQAIRAYEQYLRRAPGATDAAEIRERLRRLRESEARGGRAGGAEGAESGAAQE
ncbi:MAG: tetratricopeptide repeat protein [Deltaproteobacteria bacterium]|nr:tetratricopeptide repeat protein [Deltaproteobacteria bacterium]